MQANCCLFAVAVSAFFLTCSVRGQGATSPFDSRNVDCGIYNTTNSCDGQRIGRFLCYWSNTTNTCQVVVCRDFSTESECNKFSEDDWYNICAWKDDFNLYVGNDNFVPSPGYCYNNCTEGFEVVLTIDTSSSVQTRQRTPRLIEAIKFIMFSLWDVAGTKAQVDNLNTYDVVKFAFITFARESFIRLDLNNNFTSLDEYINFVDYVFGLDDLFRDDTATALALNDSVKVFRNSARYQNPNWTHVEVLMTDGEPTVPVLSVDPCDNSSYSFPRDFYQAQAIFQGFFVRDPNVQISDADGNGIPDPLDCFDDSPLFGDFEAVNNYSSVSFSLSSFVCANIPPTPQPTAGPSSDPTPQPTQQPSLGPSGLPSQAPSHMPSDETTASTTDSPSEYEELPTRIPTKYPTVWVHEPSKPARYWWFDDLDRIKDEKWSSSDWSDSSDSSSSSDDISIDINIRIKKKK